MTFGYHFKDEPTLKLRISNPHPGGMRLIDPRKHEFVPPKTGSESGFIREIPPERLRAGRA